jgi:hypothetical protein
MFQFADELEVPADLEAFYAMRLQAMTTPEGDSRWRH